MQVLYPDHLSLFTWVKDDKFRFVSCSENHAELAGEDSPGTMIGKDDYALVWRKDADFFRKKDSEIIKNNISYVNVVETIEIVSCSGITKQPILITKIPIYNKKGKCIGIAGSHLNLPTPGQTNPHKDNFDEKGRLLLPSFFGGEYLTKNETRVLRYILYGKTSKQIAQLLGLSYRTVEEYIVKIKKKFQCTHKTDIHSIAIKHGITHILCQE